jgi:hypothetical protein
VVVCLVKAGEVEAGWGLGSAMVHAWLIFMARSRCASRVVTVESLGGHKGRQLEALQKL